MRELFDYNGQNMGEVATDAAFNFAIDVHEQLDSIDRNIVFLSMYGRLSADWVEQQDIVRQNKLIGIVMDFMRLQNGSREDAKTDASKKWV